VIAFVRGRVAQKTLSSVVLDVGGVGYECGVSAQTSSLVPPPGSPDECTLHTYLQVRDDGAALFGFATLEERAVFERLIAISGVGPKLALSVLSSFTPDALRDVVAAGDERRMATVPGVGKKTAQRMILELKDALKTDLLGGSAVLPGMGDTAGAVAGAVEDATAALLSMGFSSAECEAALKGFDDAGADASAAVRYALRRLGSAS
jgi:Holliday junction DNA helicase RuvA